MRLPIKLWGARVPDTIPYILSMKDDLTDRLLPEARLQGGFSYVLGRTSLLLHDDMLDERVEAFVRAVGDLGLEGLLRVTPQLFDLAHPSVQAHPEAYSIRHAQNDDAIVDPRLPPRPSGKAYARIASPEALGILQPQILQRLETLAETGLAGFVFEHLDPAAIAFYRGVIARLKDRYPELLLIASIPGLSRDQGRAIGSTGFDFLLSSLGWWDFRSRWLIEEYEALRRNAPLIAHITHDAAWRASSPEEAARLLNTAAATGQGMVVPEELIARSGQSAVAVERALEASRQAAGFSGPMQLMSSAAAPVTVVVRGDGNDLRNCSKGIVLLVNPNTDASVPLNHIDLSAGCGLQEFERLTEAGSALAPLQPAEARVLMASRADPVAVKPPKSAKAADKAAEAPRIIVEDVTPTVQNGSFPVKRIVGEMVDVEATVFADGHEFVSARLAYRPVDEKAWRTIPMTPAGFDDLFTASFRLERLGRYEFAVEGWIDAFGGYRRALGKKRDARVVQSVDLLEGETLVDEALDASPKKLSQELERFSKELKAAPDDETKIEILLGDAFCALMAEAGKRISPTRSNVQLVDAERLQARFSSWYELFPRSITASKDAHGTFSDVIGELPRIRDMGFDTLYFTPIHPIGKTNRKGRNNSLDAGPDDPGSPYAIGNEAGGHDAVHPDLGTIEDFQDLVAAAHDNGLEIALDFAINCSPDHPWMKKNPEWFAWRPDGTIQYAENPPKKYEDIVNVDFYADKARPALWEALRDVVLFWIDNGVKAFRVDNPHTKPLPFWEWLIADVRARHPDVIFLAEAFTTPNLMYRLAKSGFSQSYTYFTWRNTKYELTEYFTELTQDAPKEFFRPHLFVNTPDINPLFLQTSGRPGFQIRAALAATLSGLFGVYSGYELCEAAPLPGREEFLDSEKYEIRPRDYSAPGNIEWDIALLNRLRQGHPALQTHLNTRFYNVFNDSIIYYGKPAPDGQEMILVMVLLDPHHSHEAGFEVPLWDFGLPDDGALDVEDLATGERYVWHGKNHHIRMNPAQPYRLWRVEPARSRHA